MLILAQRENPHKYSGSFFPCTSIPYLDRHGTTVVECSFFEYGEVGGCKRDDGTLPVDKYNCFAVNQIRI